jgi:D-glycero-D-manno-heptose 1,7-bisphosphate phosphatase
VNPHGRRAVFLDRDGTIIEDAGYLDDPVNVRLLPGAGAAIRKLNAGGFVVLVVTNQSGIARGLLTLDDYRATEHRLDELLANQGARLDGHYFCPHLPALNGPCECRKPGTLLYRQAAERFDLDLGRSWWVGDRPRDVLPAEAFGARGILVVAGGGEVEREAAEASRFMRVPDLTAAVAVILGEEPARPASRVGQDP